MSAVKWGARRPLSLLIRLKVKWKMVWLERRVNAAFWPLKLTRETWMEKRWTKRIFKSSFLYKWFWGEGLCDPVFLLVFWGFLRRVSGRVFSVIWRPCRLFALWCQEISSPGEQTCKWYNWQQSVDSNPSLSGNDWSHKCWVHVLRNSLIHWRGLQTVFCGNLQEMAAIVYLCHAVSCIAAACLLTSDALFFWTFLQMANIWD